jgi:hypothetical protein
MSKRYSIVGMEHRKATDFVATLGSGAEAVLVREPRNPFDPCAVAVWIGRRHVGYVPKNQNVPLAKLIDETGSPIVSGDPVEIEGMGLDASVKPLALEKSIPAKFVRSPNSGYPMVEVSE